MDNGSTPSFEALTKRPPKLIQINTISSQPTSGYIYQVDGQGLVYKEE